MSPSLLITPPNVQFISYNKYRMSTVGRVKLQQTFNKNPVETRRCHGNVSPLFVQMLHSLAFQGK